MSTIIKINVPPNDSPGIEALKYEGIWNCYNTCALEVVHPELPPTANDVQPLSGLPEGPLYFKNKGSGLNFEEAREFCQTGGGDLVSIHSLEENEAVS